MVVPEATYQYYADAYGGTAIASDEWAGYAAKAHAYLAKLDALCKVTPYGDDGEDAWKMALCAVAEQFSNFDVAANAGGPCGLVESASIGTVSVSYDATFGGAVDLSQAGREASLVETVRNYLHVYMGVG